MLLQYQQIRYTLDNFTFKQSFSIMSEMEALAAEIARMEAEIAMRQQLEEEIAAVEAAIAAVAAASTSTSPQEEEEEDVPIKKKIIKRMVRRARRYQSLDDSTHSINNLSFLAAGHASFTEDSFEYNNYGLQQEQDHHLCNSLNNSYSSFSNPSRSKMSRRASYAADPDAEVTDEARWKRQCEIYDMERLMAQQRQVNNVDERIEIIDPQPILSSSSHQHYREMERQRLEAEIAVMEAAIVAAKQSKQVQQQQKPSQQITVQDVMAPPNDAETNRERRQKQHSLATASRKEKQQQLEQEIRDMLAAIERAQQSPSSKSHQSATTNILPSQPASTDNHANLMSALASAVQKRDERLEQTGGALHFQDVDPKVAALSPQTMFVADLAALVSKAAQDREIRLVENGGVKRMTIIKEKEEYKQEFSDIVKEAAELGRLTRLNEYIVEDVAKEKTPAQTWKSKGLLAINWGSRYMSIIHEAANLGNEMKLPEKIVGNFDEKDDDDEIDTSCLSGRMKQLLELERGYSKTVGDGETMVDRLIKAKKEQGRNASSLLIRPGVYNSLEDVILPKRKPPRIDPKKAAKKLEDENRPMVDIARYVATAAWERRARLDRPNMTPKMRDACDCIYCSHASPYQTYAYKLKEQRRKENGYESPASEEERHCEQEFRRQQQIHQQQLHQDSSVSVVEDTVDPELARALFSPGSVSGNTKQHLNASNSRSPPRVPQSSADNEPTVEESGPYERLTANGVSKGASVRVGVKGNEADRRRKKKVVKKRPNRKPSQSPREGLLVAESSLPDSRSHEDSGSACEEITIGSSYKSAVCDNGLTTETVVTSDDSANCEEVTPRVCVPSESALASQPVKMNEDKATASIAPKKPKGFLGKLFGRKK